MRLSLCSCLKRIRRVTTRVAQGDLGQRLPDGGCDELYMFALLVNHMLDEVECLMSEVKITCDSIAQPFKPPVATIVPSAMPLIGPTCTLPVPAQM
ncbi:HAMP domain-containing protein [Burkholderia sp. HI2714]|uniref:HAMP domain-containing protein n=1 Tax=Burkholderia sp. HI2714 TaxID=2015359 RepID=UPI00211AE1C8|nr:HAMP domain-containing protein [Burkholderia sp. HI2714]